MTKNDFKAGAAWTCGFLLTTWQVCLVSNVINTAAPYAKVCGVFATVAIAYGIKSAYDYQKEREPWTYERKVSESMKNIAAGRPPLQGFGHLLTGAPAPAMTTVTTVTTPALLPAQPPPTPPTTPAPATTPTPPTTPPKGA